MVLVICVVCVILRLVVGLVLCFGVGQSTLVLVCLIVGLDFEWLCVVLVGWWCVWWCAWLRGCGLGFAELLFGVGCWIGFWYLRVDLLSWFWACFRTFPG